MHFCGFEAWDVLLAINERYSHALGNPEQWDKALRALKERLLENENLHNQFKDNLNEDSLRETFEDQFNDCMDELLEEDGQLASEWGALPDLERRELQEAIFCGLQQAYSESRSLLETYEILGSPEAESSLSTS